MLNQEEKQLNYLVMPYTKMESFKGSRDILRDITEKKITNDELRKSLNEKRFF